MPCGLVCQTGKRSSCMVLEISPVSMVIRNSSFSSTKAVSVLPHSQNLESEASRMLADGT